MSGENYGQIFEAHRHHLWGIFGKKAVSSLIKSPCLMKFMWKNHKRV